MDLVNHSNSVTCLVMAQVSHLDQLLFSAGKPPAVIGVALFLTLVCDDSVDKLQMESGSSQPAAPTPHMASVAMTQN